MAMPVKVKKWGDSMAVLIPSQFAKRRKIALGSIVDIEPIRLVRGRRIRYRLSELMLGFRRRHRHREWDLGGPVGKEHW